MWILVALLPSDRLRIHFAHDRGGNTGSFCKIYGVTHGNKIALPSINISAWLYSNSRLLNLVVHGEILPKPARYHSQFWTSWQTFLICDDPQFLKALLWLAGGHGMLICAVLSVCALDEWNGSLHFQMSAQKSEGIPLVLTSGHPENDVGILMSARPF